MATDIKVEDMPVRGFLERFKKDESTGDDVDYIEIDNLDDKSDGKFLIKIRTLGDFADTEAIQNDIRQNNIIFVKIKPLKDKDITELKRAVDRLRKTCLAINGDIAGIDEDFLVITPEAVKIHRG